MSIATAQYVVVRDHGGLKKFKGKGNQLLYKLWWGDFLIVQHENDDKASYFVYENSVNGIGDNDWVCCTDNNGVTYKVRGSRFKELFVIAPPELDVIVEHTSTTCTKSKTDGGRFYMQAYPRWIHQPAYHTFRVDKMDILNRDGSTYTQALTSSTSHYGYIAAADPQNNPDPLYTPTVRGKCYWTVTDKNNLPALNGVTDFDFPATPTWEDQGMQFTLVESNILKNIMSAWDGRCKIEFNVDATWFDTGLKMCMRPSYPMFRIWKYDISGTGGQWAVGTAWSAGFHTADWKSDHVKDTYIIIQAFRFHKYAYNPPVSTSQMTKKAIDNQMMEFAIRFKPGCKVDEWQPKVEFGGYLDFDANKDFGNKPKFFPINQSDIT